MITAGEFIAMSRDEQRDYLLDRAFARQQAQYVAWLKTLPVGNPTPWPRPADFKASTPAITCHGKEIS